MKAAIHRVLAVAVATSPLACDEAAPSGSSTHAPRGAVDPAGKRSAADDAAKKDSSVAAPEPAANVTDRLADLPPPKVAALSKGVVLNIEVRDTDSRRPVVMGETNLPEQTKVMVSVEGVQGFRGQAEAVVQSGRFAAGPFGPEDGLADGTYDAEVMMPIPAVQPESVRSLIGSDGELLKGKLVHRDGTDTTVEMTVKFVVGKDAASAAKADVRTVADQVKEVKAIEAELQELLKLGTGELRRLRSSEDLDDLTQCGKLMREKQPRARALRARAMDLPFPYRLIAEPATHMELCVSCLEGDSCDLAKQTLREVKAEMKTWGR